eukprot:gene1554-12680_t
MQQTKSKQNKSHKNKRNSYKINPVVKNIDNSWVDTFNSIDSISQNFSTQKLSKFLDKQIESDSKLPDNSEKNFVNFLMKIIPLVKESKEELIVSKLMNLITKISQKNEVSFGEEECNYFVDYILDEIEISKAWLRVDCLRTLNYIIFESCERLSEEIQKKNIKILLPLSKLSYPDLEEVKRQTINCFGNLCCKPQSKIFDQQKIYDILFENLEYYSKLNLQDYSKFLNSILRSLNFIIASSKNVHISNIHELVEILFKVLIESNLLDQKGDHFNFHSDSDSDCGENNQKNKIGKTRESIRLNILQIISTMAKVDFKSIFGEWKFLVPESSSLKYKAGNENLLTILLFDSSSKCRSTAAITISTLLADSSKYLAQADDRKNKSSFVTYSKMLAKTINELHVALLYAMENEETMLTLFQIIKCFSVLVQNTPYEKLNLNCMIKIFDLFPKLIESADKMIITSIFNCISIVLSKNIVIVDSELSSNDDFLFILLKSLQSNFKKESADVLSNYSKFYPKLIIKKWDSIKISLKKEFEIKGDGELVGIQILSNLTQTNENLGDLWNDIDDLIFSKLFSSLNPIIQSGIINIYSNINFTDFEKWKNKKTLIQNLKEILEDTKHSIVKTSICKFFGVIFSFPIYKEDVEFIQEIFGLLKNLLKDNNLNVKIKVSWAIGNLCDSIRQSKWIKESKYEKIVIDLILINLNFNDIKCKTNAIRALGNLSSVLNENILSTLVYCANDSNEYFYEPLKKNKMTPVNIENSIFNEIIFVIKEESNVKLRWNSCYAIGNMIQNENIKESIPQIIDELCFSIQHDENFKVRINAANSLCLINDYGDLTGKVFESIIQSIENKKVKLNLIEKKYQQNLIEQLNNNLVHILEVYDINKISKELKNHESLIKSIIEEHSNVIEDEKLTLINGKLDLIFK